MYEVPYEVKRALKLGNLRKNYKIQVKGLREPGIYEFSNLKGMYEIPEDGFYAFSGLADTAPVPAPDPPQPWTALYDIRVQKFPDPDRVERVTHNSTREFKKGEVLFVESAYCEPPYVSPPSLWKIQDTTMDDPEASFYIQNDEIIKESVKWDDRMASGKELKFGLCEGGSFEFQYFNHANINGKEIVAYISVEYIDGDGNNAWYDIPLGHFTVQECPVQFSTGIYKATAYNKLRSDYLDQKANALLIDTLTDPTQAISFGDIRHILLQDYEIKEDYQTEETPEMDEQIYVYRVGPAVTLKGRYGIDTYYNYLWLARGALSSYYPMLFCRRWRVDLETGKSYTISLSRDISAAENHLFYFIRDIFQDAITATTVETWLHSNYPAPSMPDYGSMAYNGWGSACYIKHYHGGTADYYSTIGMEAGEAGVVGKFEDIAARTIVGANGDYIEFSWPVETVMAYNTSGGGDLIRTGYRLVTYPQDTSELEYDYHWYKFYLDSSMSLQNVGQGFLDYRYPNGDPTNIENLMGALPSPSGYFELLRLFTIETTAADDVQIVPADIADITLRQATSAVYELSAQFGQLDRVTDLFSGVELNHGALYPAETLYPADGLYPNQGGGNNVIHPFPSEYQKLWTDTVGTQSFRYLIITYKGLVDDGQGNVTEADLILQRTVNADGTTDYNMSDNWLFRNLVWNESDVGDFADAMVLKMQGVRWFPFEMWAPGLPYVDVGDAIEIADRQGNTYISYILQRQLDGVHNLTDTYINGELDVF